MTKAKRSGWAWLPFGLALVLLLLFCAGAPVAIVVYVRNLEPPEKTLVGTWQIDRPASHYNPLVQKWPDDVTLEFKADGTYATTVGGPAQKGTYVVTGKTGDTLGLTLTPEGQPMRPSNWIIDVRSKDRLYVAHPTLSGFEMTRVQGPE